MKVFGKDTGSGAYMLPITLTAPACMTQRRISATSERLSAGLQAVTLNSPSGIHRQYPGRNDADQSHLPR